MSWNRIRWGISVLLIALALFAGEFDWCDSWWRIALVALQCIAGFFIFVFGLAEKRKGEALASGGSVILAGLHLLIGGAWYYRAPEIRARVVSDTDGSPIAGATVCAEWQLETMDSLEGNRVIGALHAETVTTDADGWFTVKGWGPVLRPPLTWMRDQDPSVRITTLNGDREYEDEWDAYVRMEPYGRIRRRVPHRPAVLSSSLSGFAIPIRPGRKVTLGERPARCASG